MFFDRCTPVALHARTTSALIAQPSRYRHCSIYQRSSSKPRLLLGILRLRSSSPRRRRPMRRVTLPWRGTQSILHTLCARRQSPARVIRYMWEQPYSRAIHSLSDSSMCHLLFNGLRPIHIFVCVYDQKDTIDFNRAIIHIKYEQAHKGGIP